ncbi:MAG: C39 family peptidase [Oscillospiraceae bacterium]|nr:C39 family peptidase [Oscillospiraceae bacterium]
MSDKKMVFGLVGLFAAVIIIMLLLIPVEKKHEYYKKWGELAVLAETDERAKFAIDNAELYPEYWFSMLYNENDFEYAYNYPFMKDSYNTMSFTDEELNGDEIPAIYMKDSRWAYEMNGTVKTQGCVAVSVTMANLYLNHNGNVDPVKVFYYADEMGYSNFGGINQKNVTEILEHFGMNAEEHVFSDESGEKVTESELKAAVDTEGTAVMAAVEGDTFGRHALIIRGYDENGFYINDPAAPEKTAQQWSFEVFENELTRYWIITA